jgi:hypothetical protein
MSTRITFLGEDRWSAHLAAGLNARFPETVECSAVRLAHNLGALCGAARLLRDDVIVRVGFPPPTLEEYNPALYADRSGKRERLKRAIFRSSLGRALRKTVLFFRLPAAAKHRFDVDWLQRATRWLRPQRREILYWIGTDVLNAMDVANVTSKKTRYLARTRSFRSITGAERLTTELQEIGIEAKTVPYPPRIQYPPGAATPLPATLTVLSYVPDARQEFYGLPTLVEVARNLPHVEFLIMGGSGTGLEDPPDNMTFLGFVDDPGPRYDRSSVVGRHVMHDGAGYSMAEGLLHGRHVIYTYEVPHTIHVSFGDTDGLRRAIAALRDQQASGGLSINEAGRQWAIEEFDADRRFRYLLDALTG